MMISAIICLISIIPTIRSEVKIFPSDGISLVVSSPETTCKFEFDFPKDEGRVGIFMEEITTNDKLKIQDHAKCLTEYKEEVSWMPFQRSSFDAKITQDDGEFVVNCYHRERANFLRQKKQTHIGSYHTRDSLLAEKGFLTGLLEQIGIFSNPKYSKAKGVAICKELHLRRAAVDRIIDLTAEVSDE